MKILFVINNLESGGAQRQMVNLAVGLVQRGVVVEFFLYQSGNDFFTSIIKKEEILIRTFKKKYKYSIGPILFLSRLLRTEKYDLVLSFLDTPNFYSELACFFNKNVKLVISERNCYLNGRRGIKKYFLEQFHVLADHIVVNSYFQAELMKQKNQKLINKISVIYNGVDSSLFVPTDNEENKYKKTLLCVGTLSFRKNAIGLANMLRIYKQRYGDPPCIHWVGVHHKDNFYFNEYFKVNHILKEANLLDHWKWLGEKEDMQNIYKDYIALVFPSIKEGLPNVICEAMACGLPIIASNIGEIPRLIGPENQKFLFNPNSPVEIATKVYEFLNISEGAKSKICKSSREVARTNFCMHQNITKFEDLFKTLILKNSES